MPQISLYVDDATLEKIVHAAHQQNISISKWVSGKLKEHIEPNFSKEFKLLFGAVSDSSFVEPKELSALSDSRRESL